MFATFEDILEPRRREISNFLWMSRAIHPKVSNQQRKKIGPEEMKTEVLNCPKIQLLIEKECAKGHISKKELRERIKAILDEIGYNKKVQLTRWLGLVIIKISTRVCSGLHVNKQGILALRKVMGNVPVMYVPSHRSYADFILMSYICFHYEIEIPAIAAGMDFHGMRGMGTVLRNTGAFFMRRSYNDDKLYWDTFREYVHQIVVKSELGIEFFIEGTRSRSGKSLYPKFGLFSMILKAFFAGDVPDILFVPINISYERVMEEKLFAFELLGVPKPKESTSALLKSLSLIREKYGNVYINFGIPISVHQFFSDKIDRLEHSIKTSRFQGLNAKEREAASLLALSIVRDQQKLAVITTFNLMAIVIVENLVYRKVQLTLETLMNTLIWLRDIIERFGATTNFDNTVESVLDIFTVHWNLIRLRENGQIELVENVEFTENVDRTKLKGHQLSDSVMVRSVPLITIQNYVNPTLHYFVTPSLIVIILKKYDIGVSKDELLSAYQFLKFVFGKEFVHFPAHGKREFEDSLGTLKVLDVISEDHQIRLHSNDNLSLLLCNLLQPFFVTYFIVCNILSHIHTNECRDTHIFCTTQAHIEKLLKNNASLHPYTLNLDTITNCLQSLCDLKALIRTRRDGATMYLIQQKALLEILNILDNYVECLTPTIRISLSAKL